MAEDCIILTDRNLIGYFDNDTYRSVHGNNNALKVYTSDLGTSGSLQGNLTYINTPVTTTDIASSTGYVTGSEGQMKTSLAFQTGANSGDFAKLTTLEYSNTAFPCFITLSKEEDWIVP